MPFPETANRGRQEGRLTPKFDRLRASLEAGADGLILRQDPTALAPESLIVIEITGSHVTFANAVMAIDGLAVVGEEAGDFFDPDADEEGGFLYLAIPDSAALTSLLSLWTRYKKGEVFDGTFAPWNKLFTCLHDVRRWGPQDRVSDQDRTTLLEMVGDGDDELTVEIEIAFYNTPEKRASAERTLRQATVARGGRVRRAGLVTQISYHALLVTLPAREVVALAERRPGSLASQVDVFALRPQSVFQPFTVEVGDTLARADALPTGDPILAVLDGVPAVNHPLLAPRVIVEDPDDLSAVAVGDRRHGTAMSSLVVWGDLQKAEPALRRPVVVRPVTYAPAFGDECFPDDTLIPDDMIRAVRRLVAGDAGGVAAAPTVLIINVSLGDQNKPFFRRMSPWARALDWLAYELGLLFIVSAGNAPTLRLTHVADSDAYGLISGEARSRSGLTGLRDAIAERTILSPAEATNVLTVGALHEDTHVHPETMGTSHNPLPHGRLPSLLSRVGPGFLNAVKPDLLMPGGKLRVQPRLLEEPALLSFLGGSRFGGLRVAGHDGVGTGWSGATSAAAALASRSAHHLHDACEDAYGDLFSQLPKRTRAVIIKALLVHRAQVPSDGRSLVEEIFGPAGRYLGARRKKNLQRVFGYGVPAIDESIACLTSRATLWGFGVLGENDGLTFDLPIPAEMFGNNVARTVTATVAWMSPVEPGRRAYKSVRLQVEEPDIKPLGVGALKGQAEKATTLRGTVFHRAWTGTVKRRDVLDQLQLVVSRRPDTSDEAPDQVPFGIAVSIESGDIGMPVYERVAQRIAIRPRVPIVPRVPA
ncbi:hypothetical protein D3C80_388320 [compost metagenome]